MYNDEDEYNIGNTVQYIIYDIIVSIYYHPSYYNFIYVLQFLSVLNVLCFCVIKRNRRHEETSFSYSRS